MPLIPQGGNPGIFVGLHPVFVARLEAFAADPRMEKQVKIASAVRDRQAQEAAFAKFLRDGAPKAADPDREEATKAYGLDFVRGSWHMTQDDDFAYAVDIATDPMPQRLKDLLPIVAAEYRLQQTVLFNDKRPPKSPQPPEPCTISKPTDVEEIWHLQIPFDEEFPLTWTPQEDVMTPEQEKKLDQLLKAQETLLKRTDLILDSLEGRVNVGRESPIRGLLGDIKRKLSA